MTETETEKFIESLKEWGMTEEEKNNAKARKLGKAFGDVLGNIVVLLVMPTVIWATLTFIFTLSIPWAKVFGAYFLFNIFKNIIAHSIKSTKK